MELNVLNILLVLCCAWLGGMVAKRLGYPMVLGELAAGVVWLEQHDQFVQIEPEDSIKSDSEFTSNNKQAS